MSSLTYTLTTLPIYIYIYTPGQPFNTVRHFFTHTRSDAATKRTCL